MLIPKHKIGKDLYITKEKQRKKLITNPENWKNIELINKSQEKLKQNKLIILVTHDNKLIELCDEVVRL